MYVHLINLVDLKNVENSFQIQLSYIYCKLAYVSAELNLNVMEIDLRFNL